MGWRGAGTMPPVRFIFVSVCVNQTNICDISICISILADTGYSRGVTSCYNLFLFQTSAYEPHCVFAETRETETRDSTRRNLEIAR